MVQRASVETFYGGIIRNKDYRKLNCTEASRVGALNQAQACDMTMVVEAMPVGGYAIEVKKMLRTSISLAYGNLFKIFNLIIYTIQWFHTSGSNNT